MSETKTHHGGTEARSNKQQEYFCPECRYAGKFIFRANAGIYEVLYDLQADHIKHSPNCLIDYKKIRVRNAEICSDEQWAAVIKGVAA